MIRTLPVLECAPASNDELMPASEAEQLAAMLKVLEVVQAGIGGKTVSTVIDGTKRFALQVRLDAAFRDSPQAIADIPIRTQSGALVPLSRVATVEMNEGYSFVRREQLQRYAVIQLDVRGRDVNGFVQEAETRIRAQVKLPAGYWTEWGGAFENQQRAMARLAVIVPLTVGLIFILLYTAFNSLTHATLTIANVPFAVIGGVFGLALTGQYVSVPSAIGFIAVFGVAMLNGIVLVTFLNDQRRHGASARPPLPARSSAHRSDCRPRRSRHRGW